MEKISTQLFTKGLGDQARSCQEGCVESCGNEMKGAEETLDVRDARNVECMR